MAAFEGSGPRDMLSTKEEILKAALALPLEDQLEVAETLLAESMPPEEFALDEEWKAEIARRSRELKEGLVNLVSWDIFEQEARSIIDRGA